MQFGVRSNSAARSVSDFIAAHFTHSGHFCTAATFGSLRNCKVPRPSSWRAMRTASSSLTQSAARYRALHRTTGSSLSGCSRYQEPLQELRSIACATKRPARRREGGWQANTGSTIIMRTFAALLVLVGHCLVSHTAAAAQSQDCKLCRDDYTACVKAHTQGACKTNYDICMNHCRKK